MAKMRLEPVTSQPTLPPAQLANLGGLAAQDAISTAINSAAVQVAKENNISLPQASLIVQSEVNQSFQQPNYVPNIPASLVPSLDAYKASLNAQDLAQKVVANQAAANVGGTTPSANTLANLGGTGTAKVADGNTAQQGNSFLEGDATNLGYQGDYTDTSAMQSFITPANQANANANVTKPSGDTLANLGGSALGTSDVNKMSTSPAATSSPNTINTGSIPALTTADLAGNQTALTSQNANFLKDWNTSADALKNSILSGVDTKNQAFGKQATQGFMDAFKNFQIPTNQQTGVNLGNYNDNRNAAADQWWSQYVTGRR